MELERDLRAENKLLESLRLRTCSEPRTLRNRPGDHRPCEDGPPADTHEKPRVSPPSAPRSNARVAARAELKAKLDKTMFQEACATASELKSAVSPPQPSGP